MGLSLVPATENDWPIAWRLQRAAFSELVHRENGGWTAELEARCAASWAPFITTLLRRGPILVGWFRLELRDDLDHLDLLVISPEAQGQGLGTRVIRLLKARAGARNVPLWLSVHIVNRARALYAREGFTERPRDAERVWMVWPADTTSPPPS